ncbi:MAG: glycosyltransferase family 1 protein [Verrucomicrobiota bacterium]
MPQKSSSVALMSTNPSGFVGSMARYESLVIAANEIMAQQTGHSFRTVSLAMPLRRLRLFPRKISTVVHHLWIKSKMQMVRQQSERELLHILDGSHAYALDATHGKSVCTVHDLIPWHQMHGRFASRPPGRFARCIIHQSTTALKSCSRLIAVSHCTAADLQHEFGIPNTGISVVNPALSPDFMSSMNQDIAAPGPPPRPFILHLGNNAFYKNRTGVLRIFAQTKGPPDLELIMAGPPPTTEIQSLAAELKIQPRVRFIHDPSEMEVRSLYHRAVLLLFPSLYEGWGWPPLEAMASGCPVVCSNAASLPEVAGDAALTAPTDDIPGLAILCQRVLTDPILRQNMIAKGRQHATQFTVKRMAEGLSHAYTKSAM